VRSTITDRVCREPDGRPETLVYFGVAVAFLSMYVYFAWILSSEDSFNFSLVMAVFWALMGIAESLPERRRQTAGILRLTMLFLSLCILVAIVFAPGFMLG
jgi:hypothetical protein